MAVKILVSGLAGAGKTSLIKSLDDVLVISHDGKAFNLAKPHVYVEDFDSVESLLDVVKDKVGAYKERFGELPKTIVFDSVSKIFETISNNCNKKYTGFTIYTELNKEINRLTSFLENITTGGGINLVILSHAIFDEDTEGYKLVAQGNFAKRGSFYAEVNEAVFILAKGSKRTVHLRSTKFPARTLNDDFEDSVDVSDFDLQAHIDVLNKTNSVVQDYAL